ncbi:hypothetical protein [Stenotrophomonas sp. RG-453]|uniref:hypothetical protein n=1 Tax=Stenotrophomonas sp. RG-453 TaxID=2957502 RepID=UPI0029CAA1D7|nr:hypothetical protein [Stenotrophomonas sp. RG-453]MDX5516898.1 hypothetical protein [Stenotrophomonas sp. RG-453]
MALLLIDPDYDLLLDLGAPAGVLESLHEQWLRLAHNPEREEFAARVAARLLPVLSDSLDWDLKPPTSAQISYAVSIARKLNLEIPAKVLQRRSDMGMFLDANADLILGTKRTRRGLRSSKRA